VKVTVRTDADKTVRHLRRYGNDLQNWRSFWRSTGSDLAKLQKVWWLTKGEGSWPPRKNEAKATNPLMVRTGKGMRYMTSANKFLVQRTETLADVVVPRAVYYGRYHMTGTRYMPKRPWIAPANSMRPAIRRAAARHAAYNQARYNRGG
jgi:hypothetical protein